ncbi:vWA domain-containing protein [Sedimenticola selenatireducens]|uniref:vWA domain-containing protein n=1 Tax=Sedimenticola selenatireducens TaxID=191960 RepID=UPI00048F657E|nr:vWA domain-containing protein [Sedimenticola selenatireducens]
MKRHEWLRQLISTLLCSLLLVSTVYASTGADALEGNNATGADALEGGAVSADALEGGISASPVTCDGQSPCIETATGLPLQVLPRPFANVYLEQQANPDAVAQANVQAFRPLYVFAREGIDLSNPSDPQGWYQVGSNKKQTTGWIQAKDALEWRQALVVAYTHPGGIAEGRKPVLMFKDVESLQAIVDAEDMTGKAAEIYNAIDNATPPDTVVSMEPKRYIDINRQFYILPILDWEQLDIYGDEVRLLQLAAAVPGQRGADTLDDSGYRDQASTGREVDQGAGLADLSIDVVFVMDTTRSMQPYIDMTRDAVRRMVQTTGDRLKDKVKFGLVGYRDAVAAVPAVEYTSRNFTPELVDANSLIEVLTNEARATPAGSLDYAEEVFSGVDMALRSQWRPGALRFIVLVGDASSHPRGHPQNTTGKDETDLRRELDDAGVHLISLHLQDERAAEDHDRAATQFGHLAQVRGSDGQQALVQVNAFKEGDFQAAVDSVVGGVVSRFEQSLAMRSLPPPPPMPEYGADLDVATQGQMAMDKVWEAALIEYLGKGARPPKDIVAWVMDRDLLNPADTALEVRVLVTREQLSSLVQALDRVLKAFDQAKISQGQFFEALQSVSGQTLKRPEDLGRAQSLAETGLLPAFIQSLPYRSDILSLSNEMFASLTAEQRVQLEWGLKAKLAQYLAINSQVDAWHRLNESDPASELVHPLHIDYLP